MHNTLISELESLQSTALDAGRVFSGKASGRLTQGYAQPSANGGGDDSGLYQGTQRQNIAWFDRFMLCEVGYPKPDVGKTLLAERFPVLPEELSHKLVDFAGCSWGKVIAEISSEPSKPPCPRAPCCAGRI